MSHRVVTIEQRMRVELRKEDALFSRHELQDIIGQVKLKVDEQNQCSLLRSENEHWFHTIRKAAKT